MDFEIDYVFPTVNPFDPVWRAEYSKHFSDDPVYNERHRKSPMLLKYMLRSVAKNMPWVNRMFMIVACPTQVPSWVNRDTVNVVLHKDIIPEDELPTFNTCTIDKYMNSIPRLSEHYIHAHDDFYAIKPADAGQYFSKDGVPVKSNRLSVRRFGSDNELAAFMRANKWISCCRNSFDVLKKAYGLEFFRSFPVELKEPFCAVQRHMPVPCVKSLVAKVISDCGIDKMRFSIARDFNDVMMLVVNSLYVSCAGADGPATTNVVFPTYNNAVDEKIKRMDRASFNRYVGNATKNCDQLCINNDNDGTRLLYADWLSGRFPDKCKYEA